MRILTLNLLAVALLLFSATSASAWAVDMQVRQTSTGGLSSFDVSDTITVDVFFDATGFEINLFTTSVISSDASVLQYNAAASAALPIIHPAPPTAFGTTGAQPGYILYTPGIGGMPPTPATALYPQQTPAFLPWVAPPPGAEQININYAETNITDEFGTQSTGLNIWIASMVFHVVAPFETVDLFPTMSIGPMVLEVNPNSVGSGTQIQDQVAVSGGVTLNGHLVPEPTTAALIGLGLLGLAISGRRKA